MEEGAVFSASTNVGGRCVLLCFLVSLSGAPARLLALISRPNREEEREEEEKRRKMDKQREKKYKLVHSEIAHNVYID